MIFDYIIFKYFLLALSSYLKAYGYYQEQRKPYKHVFHKSNENEKQIALEEGLVNTPYAKVIDLYIS